jgi:L-threonylcarbamoyladenylate synthase
VTLPQITPAQATAKLQEGALIIAPFDHLYAIIADARNDEALEKLRKLKLRGREKGFTILVDSDARLNRYVRDVPPLAWDIIDTAVDPIILVLPGGVNLAPNAIASDGSVAVRMVQTTEEQKLVQTVNGPVACTALLDEGGNPAGSLDAADPASLDAVDYLLTLPTEKNLRPSAKIPIIGLGMDSEVRIIRP